MVRHYKKKGDHVEWDQESMEDAVQAALNGMAVRRASHVFGVPYATLNRRYKYKKSGILPTGEPLPKRWSSVGHRTLFSKELEKCLADQVTHMGKRGFAVTIKIVCIAAFNFAVRNKIQHPWKDIAGKDWCTAFCKRNKLTLTKRDRISKAKMVDGDEDAVEQQLDILNELLTTLSLHDKPTHVYNMIETLLPLNNRLSVLVEKDVKEGLNVTGDERGENVAVVACCNAAGSYMPPLVIFKGQKVSKGPSARVPNGAVFCTSSNGQITEEIFTKWLKLFQENRVPGKVLLFLDRQLSQFLFGAMEFCQRNDIEVFCLLNTKMAKVYFNGLFSEAWTSTAAASLAEAIEGWLTAPSEEFQDMSDTGDIIDTQTPGADPKACDTSQENVATVRVRRSLRQQKAHPGESSLTNDWDTNTKCRKDGNENKKRKRKDCESDSGSSVDDFKQVEEGRICGFCQGRWSKIVLNDVKRDWINCQACETWYHKYCVGAKGCKKFVCGRCI